MRRQRGELTCKCPVWAVTYADDLALTANTMAGLQLQLNELQVYIQYQVAVDRRPTSRTQPQQTSKQGTITKKVLQLRLELRTFRV